MPMCADSGGRGFSVPEFSHRKRSEAVSECVVQQLGCCTVSCSSGRYKSLADEYVENRGLISFGIVDYVLFENPSLQLVRHMGAESLQGINPLVDLPDLYFLCGNLLLPTVFCPLDLPVCELAFTDG